MTTVTPKEGCSESGPQSQPIPLLLGLMFNVGHCNGGRTVSESQGWGRGPRVFLLLSSSCIPESRKHCDTVPTYCPTGPVCQEQARRGEDTMGAGQGAVIPSSARKRQLPPRCSVMRVLLRSELNPACAWLHLAGSRPCGFGKVSPNVTSGSSGRLGLWPRHGGTSC